MSSSPLSTHPEIDQSKIEIEIKRIVQDLYRAEKHDELTVKRVRGRVERALGLEDGYLKRDSNAAIASKAVIEDEVERLEGENDGSSSEDDDEEDEMNGQEKVVEENDKVGTDQEDERKDLDDEDEELSEPSPVIRRKTTTRAKKTATSEDIPKKTKKTDPTSKQAPDSNPSPINGTKSKRGSGKDSSVSVSRKRKGSTSTSVPTSSRATKRGRVVSSEKVDDDGSEDDTKRKDEEKAEEDETKTDDVDLDGDSSNDAKDTDTSNKTTEDEDQDMNTAKDTSKTTDSKPDDGDSKSSTSDLSEIEDVEMTSPKLSSKSTSTRSKLADSTKYTYHNPCPTRLSDELAELKRLQAWLNLCGIRKVWTRTLSTFESTGEKIKHLNNLLSEAGMKGKPSIPKANRIKKSRLDDEVRREIMEEVSYVGDTGGVVTGVGRTRASRRASAVNSTASVRKIIRPTRKSQDGSSENDENDSGDSDQDGTADPTSPKRKVARGLRSMAFLIDSDDE